MLSPLSILRHKFQERMNMRCVGLLGSFVPQQPIANTHEPKLFLLLLFLSVPRGASFPFQPSGRVPTLPLCAETGTCQSTQSAISPLTHTAVLHGEL